MLEVANLSIATEARDIVTDLSFTLPERGITALIGPSGCGKSSVLKWLAGVLAPALRVGGSLRLEGAVIRAPHAALCYQPQSDALFPWLTVAQNAGLGLELGGLSRRAAVARALPLFPAFGLQGMEQSYPETLSGGQRQRAAFLRTILQPGRFLLLDEPFSALDAVTRLKLQSWLLERLVEHPRSVLLVTHDLQEACALADQILVLKAGRISARHPIATPALARRETDLAALRDTLKAQLMED